MHRQIKRRVARLEILRAKRKKGGIAFVIVEDGETLDKALERLGIDRAAYDGLFIIEGL